MKVSAAIGQSESGRLTIRRSTQDKSDSRRVRDGREEGLESALIDRREDGGSSDADDEVGVVSSRSLRGDDVFDRDRQQSSVDTVPITTIDVSASSWRREER